MDLGSLAQMGQSMLKGADNKNDSTAAAITAMIPKEILDKLPPAVKAVATSQAIDQVARQAPELIDVLAKGGKLTGSDSEKLKAIVTSVFRNAAK